MKIDLPQGETDALQRAISRSLAEPLATVRALSTDAANFVPGFGFVNNPDLAADAIAAELGRRYVVIVAVRSGLHGYRAAIADEPLVEVSGCWQPIPEHELQHLMLTHLRGVTFVQHSHARKEIISRLLLRWKADDDYFERAPPGVNARDVFLRLDQETKRVVACAHSPDHRVTYRLRVAYEPDGGVSDVLNDGLLDMLGEDGEQGETFLQFWAAMMFSFRPALDRDRTILILCGATKSGKSTLCALVERFVPAAVRASVSPAQWSDRSHLASLSGIRLNTVTELDANGPMPGAALLKRMASHEAIAARHPHERGFTYLSQLWNLWATNKYPRFRDTDPSLLRRVMVLEVPALDPEKMDPDFLEKAWAQAPGILLLLIQQVERLAESGRFNVPPGSLERALRLQFPDEPAEIVARAHVETSPGARITSKEAQVALRLQAERMGFDLTEWSPSTGMKTWATAVEARYGAKRRKNGGSPFYEGIRFREGHAPTLEAVARGGFTAVDDEPAGLRAL